ncbi:MAG TPA: ABC transporter substrate-binding protein, partial [Micromonosporaceae bacterium]
MGIAIGIGALALALVACSSSSKGGNTTGGSKKVDWATAQSAAAGGGMDALVAAAKAEGTLNLIAVPRTWAGYGAIIDAFTAKYGIKINSENPDGSSGDEINAVKSTKG